MKMLKDRGNSGLTSPSNPNNPAGGDTPLAVSFDGTNDFLSRDTDLINNQDSKTFTFSCWVYYTTTGVKQYLYYWNGSRIFINETGYISAIIGDTSAGVGLNFVSTSKLAENTFNEIIISMDMSNTANRHVFIGDIESGVTYTSYLNNTLDFTSAIHRIASDDGTNVRVKGRLSNLFLDYTYRDLSIEANRRLFVSADGKPADGLALVDKYLDNKFYVGGDVGGDTLAVLFDNTGTKLHVLQNNGSVELVHRYTLSTAFDITTAVFDAVSTSVGQDDYPRSIEFNDDGSKMYMSGTANNSIYEYNLSTAYDITTSVYSTQVSVTTEEGSPDSLQFNADGSKMYVGGAGIHEYNLSTPYSIATKSAVISSTSILARDMMFYNNGLNMLILVSSGIVVEYSMSIAYDTTTLTATGTTLNTSAQESNNFGFEISSDGTRLFIIGNTGHFVHQYNLSTPYDISTAVYGQAEGNPQQPILYLPMLDKSTAHINEGTGGDFVQNGLIETADRGANQDNCAMSYGVRITSADTHETNTKELTVSCIMVGANPTVQVVSSPGLLVEEGTARNYFTQLSDGTIALILYDENATLCAVHRSDFVRTEGVSYACTLSINTADITKTRMIVNGRLQTTTTTNFVQNSVIDFGELATNFTYRVDYYSDKYMGEVYVDNTYIDLALDNPFWDSETNKPVPVRTAMGNMGSNPLVCMPLSADDVLKNYGSIGDFITTLGTPIGARGASEYVARSIKNDASTGYLQKSIIQQSTRQFSVAMQVSVINTSVFLSAYDSTNASSSLGFWVNGEQFRLSDCKDSNEDDIVAPIQLTGDGPLVENDGIFHTILFSLDLDNPSNVRLYIDGVVYTPTITVLNTNSIPIESLLVLASWYDSDTHPSYQQNSVSDLYFTTDYIDFSQEANRNIFVNQLGYVRDLTPEIEAGNIPTPLIYMKFEDPDDLGKNEYGSSFTVNGTVTAGSDFTL